jgi:hypothetical protein
MSTNTNAKSAVLTPIASAQPETPKAPAPAKAPEPTVAKSDKQPDISKADFLAHAKSITLTIDGVEYSVDPRQFSTGSYGYFHTGKAHVKVNGVSVKCQLQVNCTVVNSKNA